MKHHARPWTSRRLAPVSIFLLLLVWTVLAPPPSLAPAAHAISGGAVEYEWVITNITNTPAVSEEYPAICSNHVIWNTWDDGREDVFLYDLSTKKTTNLTDSPGIREWGAEISETHAMWNAQGGSAGPDVEVDGIRLSDGHHVGTDTGFDEESPALGGAWASWMYLPDGAQGDAQIFVWNLVTLDYLTFENDHDDFLPRTDGRLVVWYGFDGVNWEIFMLDLTKPDPEPWPFTDSSGNERFPDVDGNNVVWVHGERTPDWSTYLGDIFFRDMAAKETIRLTDDALKDTQPRVSGDMVTWMRDVTDGCQVLVWDRDTGRTTILSEDMAYGWNPSIHGNTVVWAGATTRHGQTDIYMAQYLPVEGLQPDETELFPDVPVGHPYEEAILDLAYVGIIGGYANGDFGLNDAVKRAQFAKMIAGTLGITPNASTSTRFTDLGPPDVNGYPHKYVQTAFDKGITYGTDSAQTLFAPWNPIRRDQVVSMIVRGTDSVFPGLLARPPSGAQSLFAGIPEPHGSNLRIAEHNDLLDGLMGVGASWSVTATATRGEVAQMLWNLLELIGER